MNESETIEKLFKLDYSRISEADIKNNIDLFYKEMSDSFLSPTFTNNI